jgi:hypothetical protein
LAQARFDACGTGGTAVIDVPVGVTLTTVAGSPDGGGLLTSASLRIAPPSEVASHTDPNTITNTASIAASAYFGKSDLLSFEAVSKIL